MNEPREESIPAETSQTPGAPARATRQIMAEILELDEVLVMDAVYNSAAEGATESNSFVAGKHAALFYRLVQRCVGVHILINASVAVAFAAEI